MADIAGLAEFMKNCWARPLSAGEARLVMALLGEIRKSTAVSSARLRQLVSAAGLSREAEETVWTLVRQQAEISPEGEMRAFFGLSLDPTPHHFQVGDKTLYTWCAFDAAFLPFLLKERAQVESRCPVCAEPVRVTITPAGVEAVAPATAVISLVLPEAAGCGTVADLRATFCDLSNYFCSAEEAAAWIPGDRRAAVLSITEAVQLGHLVVEWLLPTMGPEPGG